MVKHSRRMEILRKRKTSRCSRLRLPEVVTRITRLPGGLQSWSFRWFQVQILAQGLLQSREGQQYLRKKIYTVFLIYFTNGVEYAIVFLPHVRKRDGVSTSWLQSSLQIFLGSFLMQSRARLDTLIQILS